MGVVQRQGIKQSLVSYFGVLIGGISTLFIYPLSTEIYGLLRYLIDGALLLAPVLILGVQGLPVKFFPALKDEHSGHNGLLSFILMLVLGCFSFFAFLYWVFQEIIDDWIFQLLNRSDPLLSQFTIYILPLAFLIAIGLTITNYTSVFKRIVIPAVLNNVLVKIGLAFTVLFAIYKWDNLGHAVTALLVIYFIVILGLVVYLVNLGQLKLKRPTKKTLNLFQKEMIVYAMYAMFSSIGTAMAFRIDSIMISTLVDVDSNGIYAIGLFISNVVAIPAFAVFAASAPVVSEAWMKEDTAKIHQMYKLSSVNLTALGCLIFILIMSSLEDLVQIMSGSIDISSLYPIVLFLGLAKLSSNIAGINNQVILYSAYYKFNFIAIIILAILNLITNYVFIVTMGFGFIGAAMASALTIILYNSSKLLFIRIMFKMQPFTAAMIPIIMIAAVLFILFSVIPINLPPILTILVRSILIGSIYILSLYKLRLSSQINRLVDQIWSWRFNLLK